MKSTGPKANGHAFARSTLQDRIVTIKREMNDENAGLMPGARPGQGIVCGNRVAYGASI